MGSIACEYAYVCGCMCTCASVGLCVCVCVCVCACVLCACVGRLMAPLSSPLLPRSLPAEPKLPPPPSPGCLDVHMYACAQLCLCAVTEM